MRCTKIALGIPRDILQTLLLNRFFAGHSARASEASVPGCHIVIRASTARRKTFAATRKEKAFPILPCICAARDNLQRKIVGTMINDSRRASRIKATVRRDAERPSDHLLDKDLWRSLVSRRPRARQ